MDFITPVQCHDNSQVLLPPYPNRSLSSSRLCDRFGMHTAQTLFTFQPRLISVERFCGTTGRLGFGANFALCGTLINGIKNIFPTFTLILNAIMHIKPQLLLHLVGFILVSWVSCRMHYIINHFH